MKFYFKTENENEDKIPCEVVPFIPEKFEFDIFKLKTYIGELNVRKGLVIETSLSELFEVCPRERRRTDAYDSLIKFLRDELGIDLIISKNRYGAIADNPC